MTNYNLTERRIAANAKARSLEAARKRKADQKVADEYNAWCAAGKPSTPCDDPWM